jgi:hypothetical protein
MIQLNVVLGLLFFCLVNLPQLVHNANSRFFYRDYVATLSSEPINYTDAPSLLYIGGYEPVYYNEDGYSDTRRAPPRPPHYRRPGRARELPRLAWPRLSLRTPRLALAPSSDLRPPGAPRTSRAA